MQLLTGGAIADAVREVLRDPTDERVVAVAFVGKRPLQWIATPQGLQLYCWPLPGATHPDGIRALLGAGVHVYFVPRLHTKIYWSRQGGAVLGSANLSHSALAADGLHEAAVRMATGALDIGEVLAPFRDLAISCKDPVRFEPALAELDLEHIAHLQRNPSGLDMAPAPERTTFGQWLASPARKRWQLDYWTYTEPTNPVDPSDSSGLWPYENCASADAADALHLAVPTLEVQLNAKGTSLARSGHPFWWYPEARHITNEPAYQAIPYTWVCRNNVPQGAVVPFDADEPAFRRALKHALGVAADTMDNVDGSVNPTFLRALIEGYRP